MTRTVLILEDDEGLARSLEREFVDHGYAVHLASSVRAIPARSFDFASIDLRLRGEFGLDAIRTLLRINPLCRVVVLTGYASVSTAVEAIKAGAVDYLTKPASFGDLEAALLGRAESRAAEFRRPSLSQIEHEYIDFVLTRNGGNISRTARTLGLHRQSLQRKLKKYT